MAFYEISARGWRISSVGFGVCVAAFMIRLLADVLDWSWLVVLVVLACIVGLGLAAWGVVFGWLEARS
jgi:hypothetical protein